MANTISYMPMSDEELLRIANQRVASSYDDQMALIERNAGKKEAQYNDALQKLDPAYATLSAQVERQYGQKRQDVSDAALARGFGRSSYVTDVIGKTHDDQVLALEELSRRKAEEAEGIAAKIEALYDELFADQNRLSAAKQNKILTTIDQLRLEQSAREMEVMKYNADLAIREEQLSLQRDQLGLQREQGATQAELSRAKAQQESAQREQQMQWEREQFAYKQQMDALNREAAEREAAAKAALEAAKLAAKKTGGTSSAKSKTVDTGIVLAGARV